MEKIRLEDIDLTGVESLLYERLVTVLGRLATLNVLDLNAGLLTGLPGAGQIVFSDGAKLKGDANLTWDATNGLLVKKTISAPYGAVGQLNERFGIGSGGSVTTLGGVSIGYGAVAGLASETTPTAIGALAQADSTGAVAIGGQSRASNTGAIAIGSSASNLADHGILIGYSGSLGNTITYAIAIGAAHSVSHNYNCVLGQGVLSARDVELAFGAGASVASPLAPSFRLSGSLLNIGHTRTDAFRLGTSWIDTTYATRKARASFYIYDTAEREFLRADSNATANPLVTFFGDIQWGMANVALGGGAAPAFGTIGGAGPAAAAQRGWMRFIETDGTASFVPTWR